MIKLRKTSKILVLVLCISILGVNVFATDSINYFKKGYISKDIIIEEMQENNTVIKPAGTSVPTNKIDLGTKNYLGKFNFKYEIYSDYLLKTNTTEINISTDSTLGDTPNASSSDYYTVKLYKKTLLGGSEIGTFQAPRKGTKDGKFINLSSSNEYFLILTKGTDGNSIVGTILAYE